MIKDFLTKKELEKIWEEIDELKGSFKAGVYMEKGVEKVVEGKTNTGVIVNDKFPKAEDSYIRSLFWYRFQMNPDFAGAIQKVKEPFWSILSFTKNELTKISRYGDGDKYDWHPDISKHGLVTITYMISKYPEHFTGGDFEFRNPDGEIKTIPFAHNSIVIFPRFYEHRVTPIKSKGLNWHDARFSIQWFVNIR